MCVYYNKIGIRLPQIIMTNSISAGGEKNHHISVTTVVKYFRLTDLTSLCGEQCHGGAILELSLVNQPL